MEVEDAATDGAHLEGLEERPVVEVVEQTGRVEV